MTIIHACTTNDTNGNPRRCYVEINTTGEIVKVEDEGYAGTPGWVRDARSSGSYDLPISVTPAQYKDFLRRGRDL